MTYPPPPGLAFLAYVTGSITKAEFKYLTKLWREKHKTPEEVSKDEADTERFADPVST